MNFNDKPLFQTLRTLFGPLTQRQVDKIKLSIIEGAYADSASPVIPNRDPSPACIALIKEFEGCARKRPDGRFDAYPDPGSGGHPWTIGWGSTGSDIRKGVIWTQQQCDERFAEHLNEFADEVDKVLGDVPTTQNEFDALVSLAYNIGTQKLADSTLMRMHKDGDTAGAAAQFERWNKAAGRVLPGLTRRRMREAALYRGQG